MSGVWVFSNGVARLVQNPRAESGGGSGRDGSSSQHGQQAVGGSGRRKVLVYRPCNHVILSHGELEARLLSLGWSRYPQEQPGTLQYHRGHSSNHLITVPRDFRNLKPMHLLDIAMKNRDYFEVRDVILLYT
ncbi:hypothetical protein KP509_04G069500 [Ceratopteris richardii]|uniref:Flowering-promoting factor 1-like protein 3 n=1 Tax=Ceratopteris richardii TaxID=49495 RepID=A0A8T2UY33_CERRI|nr:hypothetical protein KP509_04G069500 [Ceratopteris richardii]